jgi:hypothetical protein
MRYLFFYAIIILIFSHCVSKQELLVIQHQVDEIKEENNWIKKQTKWYLDSQRILKDTLIKLKSYTDRLSYKQKTEVFQQHFISDSMKIERCSFATRDEKDTYHYLNYARTKPREFCEKFVIPYWDKKNSYHNSLVKTMMKMEPVNPIFPDFQCYQSAWCHALKSGKTGYIGHSRNKDPQTGSRCNSYFMGECCAYGSSDGLGIILMLLIDDGVPSLGHRNICLSSGYRVVGISIQPHSSYRHNCVLDFM